MLPMYQRSGPVAYKNNLDNTIQLDNFFGNPHKKFKSVHVAGTNGKGSVSHMMAAIFQKAGYKTGLYTSPHLKDFRERIRINGRMISEQFVVDWVEQFRINNEMWKIEPSFFELTVIMAFDYFAQEKVDIAIIEVGLGGRLDSTNIIIPELGIITNIGLDHIAILGDTMEKIAAEKAGIIKTDIPVVIGTTQEKTQEIFKANAQLRHAPLFFADQEYSIPYSMQGVDGKQIITIEQNGKQVFSGLKLDLRGMYQRKNLPAVLKSIEIMRKRGWDISDHAIMEGLANTMQLTGLKGRWQILGANPMIVCDTAHNFDGIKEVVDQLRQTPYKNLHIVFGMVNDKDPDRIFDLLPGNAIYYFTKASIPRAMDENELAAKAAGFGLKGECFVSVKEAFGAAKSNAENSDLVFVGGSTFVVAEIL
jgi:dihydrofolate synthase/folylpolyglutamate synthase